jgi:hypothetical protein
MRLIVVTSVRNQDRARVVLPVELHGRLVAAEFFAAVGRASLGRALSNSAGKRSGEWRASAPGSGHAVSEHPRLDFRTASVTSSSTLLSCRDR